MTADLNEKVIEKLSAEVTRLTKERDAIREQHEHLLMVAAELEARAYAAESLIARLAAVLGESSA